MKPGIKKWKRHGEVRLYDDGNVDEIVLRNVQTFHLEQLGDDSFWIGLYLKNGDMMHVNIFSKNLRSLVTVNCETEDGKIKEGFRP